MFKRPGVLVVLNGYKFFYNVRPVKLVHDWVAPQGHDTGIKITYRKLKKKVPLILPNKNLIKWYICGPTVYDDSHVGHASCYIRFDIINRILREFFNIRPVIALGITDVDDKIIIQGVKKKVDFRNLAKKYELEFFNSLSELNVLPPGFVLRVTEHIPDIIDFISKIIEKGDGYVAAEDGSVYFNTPPDKWDQPHNVKTALKPGQKHESHFALWKGSKEGEPYWEAPWGRGRPGWHIECSAMASKIFGSQIDLHGGGIDLAFPHHNNEELQSCSYHGCSRWVNYWIYSGELMNDGEKMSKSLKNFVTIKEFLKDYTPDNLRMFSFITKYNKGLHFNPDAVGLAVSHCSLISKYLADSKSYVKGNWTLGNISESDLLQDLEETKRNVREFLADDFDTAQCHVALMELIRKTVRALNESPEVSSSRCPAAVHAVSQYVRDVYGSFGFRLGTAEASEMSKDGQSLEFILENLVDFRRQVRAEALTCGEESVKQNLLKACDSLREELGNVGIVVKDQGKDKCSWSFVETEKSSERSAG